MCPFFQKSESSKYRQTQSVSDIRLNIRFPFENSFWISVSGCKLTILPDIQPINRIVIITGACNPKLFYDKRLNEMKI